MAQKQKDIRYEINRTEPRWCKLKQTKLLELTRAIGGIETSKIDALEKDAKITRTPIPESWGARGAVRDSLFEAFQLAGSDISFLLGQTPEYEQHGLMRGYKHYGRTYYDADGKWRERLLDGRYFKTPRILTFPKNPEDLGAHIVERYPDFVAGGTVQACSMAAYMTVIALDITDELMLASHLLLTYVLKKRYEAGVERIIKERFKEPEELLALVDGVLNLSIREQLKPSNFYQMLARIAEDCPNIPGTPQLYRSVDKVVDGVSLFPSFLETQEALRRHRGERPNPFFDSSHSFADPLGREISFRVSEQMLDVPRIPAPNEYIVMHAVAEALKSDLEKIFTTSLTQLEKFLHGIGMLLFYGSGLRETVNKLVKRMPKLPEICSELIGIPVEERIRMGKEMITAMETEKPKQPIYESM